MAESSRDTDLVLALNEYAFIQDLNTGLIKPIVGPAKKTLDSTEQPVLFDSRTEKFVRVSAKEAIQIFPIVDERSYLILENPTLVGEKEHPTKGQDNAMPLLRTGQKQNIPGPASFPLWPGQIANVIQGHQLRSNQYLRCVVHNAKEAIANWSKAVIDSTGTDDIKNAIVKEKNNLVTGQILIIKGTEVSYYIPPTGINVVPDENGEYVRDAVTLERLDYCILLDESGKKRYLRGPSVVFPEPTEKFVNDNNGHRTFKAIELNDDMGIYIKVIADYDSYKAGEELFITGEEQKIYYPREEHAIIKYDNQVRHYAVAIPKGEARYVLNKLTGDISTIKGPIMFLPDPRTQVIVKRVLSDREAILWFPGNEKALAHNRALREQTENTREAYSRSMPRSAVAHAGVASAALYASSLMDESSLNKTINYVGDDMKRGTTFTKPRSITLDSKFDGAVNINVWPGYAVQVVSKNGQRKIVIGPESVILEYDETLEVMELSTGKPKDDHNLLSTVYLRVMNNRVSDIIEATTKDMVNISARVNYRVNFEGESSAWFSTENYVKFLTQNLRSIIRHTIQQFGIEEVYHNIANIVRDVVLGPKVEGKERNGRIFTENGMKIIDVEILTINIGDNSIKERLMEAQYNTIQSTLDVAQARQELLVTQETEQCAREKMEEQSETALLNAALARKHQEMLETSKKAELYASKIIADLKAQIDVVLLETNKKVHTEANEFEEKRLTILSDAFERKFKAITPDLIAALESSGNKQLATAFAEHIPQAGGGIGMILGRQLIENLIGMVKGTSMESALTSMVGNSQAKAAPRT